MMTRFNMRAHGLVNKFQPAGGIMKNSLPSIPLEVILNDLFPRLPLPIGFWTRMGLLQYLWWTRTLVLQAVSIPLQQSPAHRRPLAETTGTYRYNCKTDNLTMHWLDHIES